MSNIIEMAENAGIPFNKWGMVGCDECEQDIDDALTRFAALIRADERERCAQKAMMVADNGVETSAAIREMENA